MPTDPTIYPRTGPAPGAERPPTGAPAAHFAPETQAASPAPPRLAPAGTRGDASREFTVDERPAGPIRRILRDCHRQRGHKR